MSRVKVPKVVEEGFFYDEEDLRFGTPKEVADYRAERLKCNNLVEIGAGVGFQTIAFARVCKKVIAIESDDRKFAYLEKNLAKQKNVTVIHGDALDPDIIKKAGKADIVFVDTERPPVESERKIESIRPQVSELISTYGSAANGICIEVPPHLDIGMMDCEREYVSLHGKLNRLNLYFGKLKICDKSVILLPSKERIEGEGKKLPGRAYSAAGADYIHEMNPALALAGIVGDIAKGMKLVASGKKEYLISKDEVKSPFLITYKIIAVCEDQALSTRLRDMKCGKVVLKYSIDPSEYWKERTMLEKGLSGERVCYVFRLGSDVVICELR